MCHNRSAEIGYGGMSSEDLLITLTVSRCDGFCTTVTVLMLSCMKCKKNQFDLVMRAGVLNVVFYARPSGKDISTPGVLDQHEVLKYSRPK